MPSKKSRIKEGDDFIILVLLENHITTLQDNSTKSIYRRNTNKNIDEVYRIIYNEFISKIDKRRRVKYCHFAPYLDKFILVLNLLYSNQPVDNSIAFRDEVMQGFRSIVQKYPFVEDSSSTNPVSPNQDVDHANVAIPENRLPVTENQKPQPKPNPTSHVPPKPQFVPNTNNPVNPVYTNNVKNRPHHIPVYPGYVQSANQIPIATQRGTFISQPNGQGRCIARPSFNQKMAGNTLRRGAHMYCDRNGSIVFENCNVTIQRVYSESTTGHARMQVCGLNVIPKESEQTVLCEEKYDSVMKKLDSLLERIHQQKRQRDN